MSEKKKLLLDEMYTGLKEYFEFEGWEVSTAREESLEGADDKKIVKHAKENGFLLVTHDQKPAELASLQDVPYVLVSNKSIVRLIESEIREKYKAE